MEKGRDEMAAKPYCVSEPRLATRCVLVTALGPAHAVRLSKHRVDSCSVTTSRAAETESDERMQTHVVSCLSPAPHHHPSPWLLISRNVEKFAQIQLIANNHLPTAQHTIMLRTFASSSSRAVRAVRFNSTQAPQQSTAYVVERTANGTLPVYSDVKNNSTKTIIRRIRGSAEVSLALRRARGVGGWSGNGNSRRSAESGAHMEEGANRRRRRPHCSFR